MVGATGFEPATPTPPVWCATGLRYAPTERAAERPEGGALRGVGAGCKCQHGAPSRRGRSSVRPVSSCGDLLRGTPSDDSGRTNATGRAARDLNPFSQIRNFMFIAPAYAQAADGAATAGGGLASFLSLAPLFLVFVVFYFLMIRPQQKRMKALQASVAAVKKNDSVVTSGGILGKVTKVEDNVVEVEIAPNVRVRVVKATLTDITSPNTKPAND